MRQYSSDGGKGESESGKGGGGGGGFFQNFVSNLRRGLFKDKEMQENLKGFQEETDKMQQSFVLQQARLKMGLAKVAAGGHATGRHGAVCVCVCVCVTYTCVCVCVCVCVSFLMCLGQGSGARVSQH